MWGLLHGRAFLQRVSRPVRVMVRSPCDLGSDISVTETITETEITDPALTETKTMLIYETEII